MVAGSGAMLRTLQLCFFQKAIIRSAVLQHLPCEKRKIAAAVKTVFTFFSPKHLRCKQKSSFLCSVNLRIGYPGKFPARARLYRHYPLKIKPRKRLFLLSQFRSSNHDSLSIVLNSSKVKIFNFG